MTDKKPSKITVFSYFKNQKSFIIIIVLIIIGILLLLIPTNSTNKRLQTNDETRLIDYSNMIEDKIAEMCSYVNGVSNVKVTVYFDSGFETIYAYNEESKSSSSGINSEKKYVTLGSGSDESMVCVLEKMPTICGVAIVCRGGGNSLISSEIINLISSAFGVSKNKIYVTEGKK